MKQIEAVLYAFPDLWPEGSLCLRFYSWGPLWRCIVCPVAVSPGAWPSRLIRSSFWVCFALMGRVSKRIPGRALDGSQNLWQSYVVQPVWSGRSIQLKKLNVRHWRTKENRRPWSTRTTGSTDYDVRNLPVHWVSRNLPNLAVLVQYLNHRGGDVVATNALTFYPV